MKLWEKSLRDSEKSLTLNPDWTKVKLFFFEKRIIKINFIFLKGTLS